MRLILVVGTRPNFVKVGPLIPALQAAGHDVALAFTGSRSSSREEPSSGEVYFYGVEVPTPQWFLDVGDGTHADQTGRALTVLEELLGRECPDAVLVVGDANSTLAAAIAAAKHGVPIVHLEAGLRCGDMRAPEEVNRALISRVASVHMVCTEEAMANLVREGVQPDRVHFVGSLMAESVLRHMDGIRKLDAAAGFGLALKAYALASFHRDENVRHADRLRGIIEGLGSLDLDVLVPDTDGFESAVEASGIGIPANVRVVPAVAYSDMLALQRDARVIVTDSSGIQEEACVIGTPCVSVRTTTEHGATVDVGANRLADATPHAIAVAVAEASVSRGRWTTPKRWDKSVSSRIVRELKRGLPPLV
ncbi:MAG: UDP-N-acetylglucosamine 2-epimerase (non-hydrolyzing) [Coriobacteriia bacterium]|nr:UDP-N-acetylglucosamine 2-epimerase (non-hydrolyzing) [Coriobacteriia bacterium]